MKETTPKWLLEIQNNSWSPEILISGLTITFILYINNGIYNLFAMIIQDAGAEVTGMVGYRIFIHCINVVKVVLIFHLLLRGLWAGLVGLSYVYPDGINREKLPVTVRHVEFDKPADMVLKVESICSLIFSVMFIFIFFMILISVMYTPMLIIESMLFENYLYILFGLFLLILVASAVMIIFRKSKLISRSMNNIFNNVAYTLSSNTGNKITILLFGVLIVMSLFISRPQIRGFNFENESRIEISDDAALDAENYYTKRNNDLRISRMLLPDFRMGKDFEELFVSRYKSDDVTISRINEGSKGFEELGFSLNPGETTMVDLYQIFIDSVKVEPSMSFSTTVQKTGQRGYNLLVPMGGIEEGVHVLRVNKLFWDRVRHEFKLIENWENIPFLRSIN